MIEESKCDYWTIKPAGSKKYIEIGGASDEFGVEFLSRVTTVLPKGIFAKCSDNRTTVPDCIYSITQDFVLSERAAKLFRRFRLGDAKSVPLTIMGRNGRERIGNAEMLVSPGINFLDLTRSSFVPLRTEPGVPVIVMYYTAPPVVHRHQLKGLDFAEQSLDNLRVCSSELKVAIEEEKLTDFAFRPVVVR